MPGPNRRAGGMEQIMKGKSFSVMLKAVLLSVFLAGCSTLQMLVPRHRDAGGWVDWDGRGGWTGTESDTAFFTEELESSASVAGAPEEAPAPALADSAGRETGEQLGRLRAGSVDDNKSWDDYLQYRIQAQQWGLDVHDIDVAGRHVIVVIDQEGSPVLGATALVEDDQGREIATLNTPADGRILFFPGAYGASPEDSFNLQISKGDSTVSLMIDQSLHEHTLTLNTRRVEEAVRLDVLFLIDATGSMSDEIQQLKENMIRVSERIDAFASRPDVRFGMTVYRDREDLFTSRTYDFTPDVEAFTQALQEVVAEGGGDYPESLNEGLHDALQLPEWRVNETVSLIFLIADAPPHLDYQQDHDYAEEALKALERGIKIFPIGSSGLDDQGEYIYRQLAQISGGKFLFLTYGAGGAPGDETSHHVDDYSVLSLDDLVVRIVQEELGQLQPKQ